MDRVTLYKEVLGKSTGFGDAQAVVMNEYIGRHPPKVLAWVLTKLQKHYLSRDASQKAS